jgi:hypothetical protein
MTAFCAFTDCVFGQFTRNDDELNKLLFGMTVAHGGVLPNIQAVFMLKKTA